jgi:hypothetical protein
MPGRVGQRRTNGISDCPLFAGRQHGVMPRKLIWEYLQQPTQKHWGSRLIQLVRGIAEAPNPPPALKRFNPSAINYLANGEDWNRDPQGLAGRLPMGTVLTHAGFTGINWGTLKPLMDAKVAPVKFTSPTPEQLCGFVGTQERDGLAGLSILLSGWTDFCLYCWAMHPSATDVAPRLVLSSDYYTLCDTLAGQPICSGIDFGVADVWRTRMYWSRDPKDRDVSTPNLFSAIASKANGKICLPTTPLTGCELVELERYIARNKLLVINVWPWFRVGNGSTSSTNIHADFGKVVQVGDPVVGLVARLSGILTPGCIATLGSRFGTVGSGTPEPWLAEALPGKPIELFYHPSAPGKWPGHRCGKAGFENWLSRNCV